LPIDRKVRRIKAAGTALLLLCVVIEGVRIVGVA
jgi:hypothetical protein